MPTLDPMSFLFVCVLGYVFAAAAGAVGFILLMRSSPDGLVSAPSGKALNRPTPPRGG